MSIDYQLRGDILRQAEKNWGEYSSFYADNTTTPKQMRQVVKGWEIRDNMKKREKANLKPLKLSNAPLPATMSIKPKPANMDLYVKDYHAFRDQSVALNEHRLRVVIACLGIAVKHSKDDEAIVERVLTLIDEMGEWGYTYE